MVIMTFRQALAVAKAALFFGTTSAGKILLGGRKFDIRALNQTSFC